MEKQLRWCCGSFSWVIRRTLVMGVVNVTPDSFSDGGCWDTPEAGVEHGLRLWAAGADILDVGGESTRPGALPVSVEQEIDRVAPVVSALAREGACVSVDTSKAAVAAVALASGASIVNDVSSGGDPDMFPLLSAEFCGLVLMHMRGEPRTMQRDPVYDDVVGEVCDWLSERVAAAGRAGIARDRLILDPGIGFGKTLQHNLMLLAGLPVLSRLGLPLLVGTSRKSFFQRLFGLEVEKRLETTLATQVWASLSGASVVRVHDVTEAAEVAAISDFLEGAAGTPFFVANKLLL